MSSSLPLLALHGWRTNGKILSTQTAALRYHCGIQIVAPNAPFAAQGPPDPGVSMVYPNQPYFQWWIRRDDLDQADPPYEGVEESLAYLVEIVRSQGPFRGILGFSQGTAMVTLLMSRLNALAEKNQISRSFIPSFAILICGIPPPLPLQLEEEQWPIHRLELTAPQDEWRSSFLPKDNSNPSNNPLINFRSSMPTQVTKDTTLTSVLNYNNGSDALLGLINSSSSEAEGKLLPSSSPAGLSLLNDLINRLNAKPEESQTYSQNQTQSLSQSQSLTFLRDINPVSSVSPSLLHEDEILSKYHRISHQRLGVRSLHLYGSKDFLLLRSFFLASLYDSQLKTEFLFNEGHHIPSLRTKLYPEVKKFIEQHDV